MALSELHSGLTAECGLEAPQPLSAATGPFTKPTCQKNRSPRQSGSSLQDQKPVASPPQGIVRFTSGDNLVNLALLLICATSMLDNAVILQHSSIASICQGIF